MMLLVMHTSLSHTAHASGGKATPPNASLVENKLSLHEEGK